MQNILSKCLYYQNPISVTLSAFVAYWYLCFVTLREHFLFLVASIFWVNNTMYNEVIEFVLQFPDMMILILYIKLLVRK